MSMPWDRPPQQPPQPQQIPQQQIPPQPQQMQPDIVPVVARNPATGETVRVDIGAQLQRAVQDALAQAMAGGQIQANAQKLITNAVAGKKSTLTAPTSELEGEFEMGPATKRTLFNGLAVDLGFAGIATLATLTSTNFDITDKAAWSLAGAMLLKTAISTLMSYVMRLKVD